MKKIIMLALTICMVLPLSITNVASGTVNSSGNFLVDNYHDLRDIQQMLNYIVGTPSDFKIFETVDEADSWLFQKNLHQLPEEEMDTTALCMEEGDMNGDGEINIKDVLEFFRRYLPNGIPPKPNSSPC